MSASDTKAISINQPWAWLIVRGFKPVENRNWYTEYRGRVLVHAGMNIDKDFDYEFWSKIIGQEIPHADTMQKGGIVGETNIVDCVATHLSPFFFGKHGFVLEDSIAYEDLIPCKGALGFFPPDYSSRYKEKPEKIKKPIEPAQGKLL